MSRDLLAEFADFGVQETSQTGVKPHNDWASSYPTGHTLQPQNGLQQPQSNIGPSDLLDVQDDPRGEVGVDEDDDFGDFEIAGKDDPYPEAVSTPSLATKAVSEIRTPSLAIPTQSLQLEGTKSPVKVPPEVRYQPAKTPTETLSKVSKPSNLIPVNVSTKAPPEIRHQVDRPQAKIPSKVTGIIPAKIPAKISSNLPPELRHKVEKAAPKSPAKIPVKAPSKPAARAPRRASASARGKSTQLPSDHPMAALEDVLFDADDFDNYGEGQFDDDFGDFEISESSKPVKPVPSQITKSHTSTQQTPQPAMFDLLGLDDDPQPAPVQARQNPPPKAQPTTRTIKPNPVAQRPPPPSRQESTLSQDDAWDDFESAPATSSKSSAPPPKPPQRGLNSTTTTTTTKSISHPIELPNDLLGPLLSTTHTSLLLTPPTTIPPPSTLLPLFTPLLQKISTDVLTPLSLLPSPQKQPFLSSPALHDFLPTYIALTHVLARLLAGRKLRWKRDKHLAQSMRIGAASLSGRSGGMKLVGLDKSEVGREDAEVEDVLAVWGMQVGRLRTLVAAAASAAVAGKGRRSAGIGNVPDLAAAMPVRVAKAAEGGIAGLVACALCGLRREERVVKVDGDVEDSFGEWWVEGPGMHLTCRNFWEVHRGRLMGR